MIKRLSQAFYHWKHIASTMPPKPPRKALSEDKLLDQESSELADDHDQRRDRLCKFTTFKTFCYDSSIIALTCT